MDRRRKVGARSPLGVTSCCCSSRSGRSGARAQGAAAGEELRSCRQQASDPPCVPSFRVHLLAWGRSRPGSVLGEEGREGLLPWSPGEGAGAAAALQCPLQRRLPPGMGCPCPAVLPRQPGFGSAGRSTHPVDTRARLPAARGAPWQGAQVIKPQPVVAVLPFFHQLSPPILCFLLFWESSALFNKKKGLLRYTRELMIDSDFFNNSAARQALSTHSTQRMPWRGKELQGFAAGCWGLRLLPRQLGTNPPICPEKRGFHLGIGSCTDLGPEQGEGSG